MASYVNEAYNPEKLSTLFDRPYVFETFGFGGDPIHMSALLWFVLSLILVHLVLAAAKRLTRKKNKKS